MYALRNLVPFWQFKKHENAHVRVHLSSVYLIFKFRKEIFFFHLACECDVNGSEDGECIADIDDGCNCKRGYTGRYCDECLPGFFGFPDCKRKYFRCKILE